MFAVMTNREKYREYLQKLQLLYSANEAAIITDWVFEKIAGLQRAEIIKNPGHLLNDAVLDQLNRCLTDLLLHKPVQYVLGEAWFYKMKLLVNENTLIPRPETEELVQLVIDNRPYLFNHEELPQLVRVPVNKRPLQMLDIGTGSGCIAIALKKNLPDIDMRAIDISLGAIAVAKQNAMDQSVEVNFLQLDFLDESNWKQLTFFDTIISNPPYIPFQEKERLDKNVSAFEPSDALFVPDNAPLLFYEKIVLFGQQHLYETGKIFVEFHEDFGKETKNVFERFYNVEIKKDSFGKDRMLIATKIGKREK